MNHGIWASALAWALACAGCTGSQSFTGSVDGAGDPDAPGDTSDDPDAPGDTSEVTPPPDACLSDSDCVIAQPYTCCNGCPFVTIRSELAAHECFYERGTVPGPEPIGCMMDCYACYECYPQPITAACRGGFCVEDVVGCPALEHPDPPAIEPAVVAADPAAHLGRTYRMTGSTIALWPVCDGFCPGDAPCCDASMYLDGVVRLGGWPCDAALGCTADSWCPLRWDCGAFVEGAAYEVVGEIVSVSGWEPPLLMVEGIREVEPDGYGGSYEAVVTGAGVWSDDPGVDCSGVFDPDDDVLARFVVASAGEQITVSAPSLDLFGWCMDFVGTVTDGSFDAWIPVDCDGCCCDSWIGGRFEDGRVSGVYHYFDGVCHVEMTFEGSR